MLVSRARKYTYAMDYVSPANSSNRKWLTNKHPTSFIAQSGNFNDDYDYYDDDDGDREYNYSGYSSKAKNTSLEFVSMMEGDFRRGSSFASCNAWSLGCSSPMDGCPTTPSPICSPVSSISWSPHSEFNQASTEEIEQESLMETKMGDGKGSSMKRNISKLKLAKAVKYADAENSVGRSSYHADDYRLPAVFEVQEDETFSSGSSAYSCRESETSDIESVIEDCLESRGKNKLADKLSSWKEDRTMKIMDKLMGEEAAIIDWENKTTTKAKMVMKEIEAKLEEKRKRAMQNMERKIIRAQKEAKKKKFRERAAANKKIAKVEVFKKKTANTGNWILYVLKAC